MSAINIIEHTRNLSNTKRPAQLKSVNRIFTERESAFLRIICASMIAGGKSISVISLNEILSHSQKGKVMLQKYKIRQLMSRLKYERLQYREVDGNN